MWNSFCGSVSGLFWNFKLTEFDTASRNYFIVIQNKLEINSVALEKTCSISWNNSSVRQTNKLVTKRLLSEHRPLPKTSARSHNVNQSEKIICGSVQCVRFCSQQGPKSKTQKRCFKKVCLFNKSEMWTEILVWVHSRAGGLWSAIPSEEWTWDTGRRRGQTGARRAQRRTHKL